jgi:hypothetical protein
MTPAVVIVYPSAKDGPIVRWYISEATALYGSEVASASALKVCIQGASEQVAAEAFGVHRHLREDRHADVSWAATHRRLTIGMETELVRLDQAGPAREPVPLVARHLDRLMTSATAMRDQLDARQAELDEARTDLANLQAVAARFAERAEVELAQRTAERDRAVRDADRAGEIRHATWVQAQRLRGELAVSMSQTASNHAKLLDALDIEGSARESIDPIATVRGLRDYIEQLKADQRSQVEPGICGRKAPRLSGNQASVVCELKAGHAGWHRSGGQHWNGILCGGCMQVECVCADLNDRVVR